MFFLLEHGDKFHFTTFVMIKFIYIPIERFIISKCKLCAFQISVLERFPKGQKGDTSRDLQQARSVM
jgi:hypothetical protein